MKNKKPLKDRLALVTGASRGIGRAVALALAQQRRARRRRRAHHRRAGGARRRDPRRRRQGDAAAARPLARASKIDQLGPTLYQRWGKLDILVGNAGILGPLSPLHHVTEDAWNSVIEINLSANWRLIRTLDPLLKRSDAGRAVFVTSAQQRASTPTGDRTRCRRPGSKRWSRPTPTRSPTPRCASTSSTRGRCARRCAPRPFPARIQARCRHRRTWCRCSSSSLSPACELQRTRRQFPRLAEEARPPDRRLSTLQSNSMTMPS